jgi:hypothetical protein
VKKSPQNVVNSQKNANLNETSTQAAQLREIESLKQKLDEELNKNVQLNIELLQFKTSNVLLNDKHGESLSSINNKNNEIKFQIQQIENGIDDYFE